MLACGATAAPDEKDAIVAEPVALERVAGWKVVEVALAWTCGTVPVEKAEYEVVEVTV